MLDMDNDESLVLGSGGEEDEAEYFTHEDEESGREYSSAEEYLRAVYLAIEHNDAKELSALAVFSWSDAEQFLSDCAVEVRKCIDLIFF